jgi:NAD-dependent deacetylase
VAPESQGRVAPEWMVLGCPYAVHVPDERYSRRARCRVAGWSVSVRPLDPGLVDLVRQARRVVALTGAGMSAESGVPTFRDEGTGLWARFDPAELATPEAWESDPELVWAWYGWRISLLRTVEPHAGHRALAEWSASAEVLVVTQNVDDLHERAGSVVLAHLHGSLLSFRCASCGCEHERWVDLPEDPVERLAPPRCTACGGLVRPGVVWFGEPLPERAFDLALDAVRAADLVLVVGTSGLVYPAATLPLIAAGAGVPVVEVNPQETEVTESVTHHVRATAAVALPELAAAASG